VYREVADQVQAAEEAERLAEEAKKNENTL